jgi:hypothetical protein
METLIKKSLLASPPEADQREMVRQFDKLTVHHDRCHPEHVEGWQRGARVDFFNNGSRNNHFLKIILPDYTETWRIR